MFGTALIRAAAALVISSAAQAQKLTIVEVGAPAVNCVFHKDCKLTVTDTTGNILLPTLTPGTAWLQSRTFDGGPGVPGAGTTGFEYRISLTQASGNSECIVGFTLNFGPHKPLPYKTSALADVYVITSGGLGSIGLAAATRFGDAITFDLKAPLCADGPPNNANTTFFIGLAATAAVMHHDATIAMAGMPPFYAADARVPVHKVASDPPGGL